MPIFRGKEEPTLSRSVQLSNEQRAVRQALFDQITEAHHEANVIADSEGVEPVEPIQEKHSEPSYSGTVIERDQPNVEGVKDLNARYNPPSGTALPQIVHRGTIVTPGPGDIIIEGECWDP